MKMIVTKPFRPSGSGSRLLKVGDKYTAVDKRQAKLMRAMGWVVDAPPEPTAPPPTMRVAPARVHRKVEAPPSVPALEPIAGPIVEPGIDDAVPDTATDQTTGEKPKRHYRRRDLVADNE